MEEGEAHPAYPCCPCQAQSAAVFTAAVSGCWSLLPGAPLIASSPASSLFRPRPWLSGCAAVVTAEGSGGPKRQGSLPTPLSSSSCSPRRPPPSTLCCCREHVVGDFQRGPRGGAKSEGVGGVKVGAQQNPPPCAWCRKTVCSDLRTGGRSGLWQDVDQSSPDPPGLAHDAAV